MPAVSLRLQTLVSSATVEMAARVREAKQSGREVYDFTVGEPDLPTPEPIKQAAQAALYQNKTKYGSAAGEYSLREAIGHYLRQTGGPEYQPDQIMITSGGKQALYSALQLACNPGDEVILFSPQWVSYLEMIRLCGGIPVTVPPGDSRTGAPDFAAFARLLSSRTKIVLLNSPCNPTGYMFTRDELEYLVRLAEERDWFIISDEVYDHITYGVRPHLSPAALGGESFKRTLVINSFSKTFRMTGWRLGYVAGPAAFISRLVSYQGQTAHHPSMLSQWAGLAALEGDGAGVKELQKSLHHRRQVALSGMREIPGIICPEPMGAFYLFPDVSAYFGPSDGSRPSGSVQLAGRLWEVSQVATVPGLAFGDDRCIRFSFAVSEEILKKGIKNFGNFLKNLLS